jgi:hypothetical protein
MRFFLDYDPGVGPVSFTSDLSEMEEDDGDEAASQSGYLADSGSHLSADSQDCSQSQHQSALTTENPSAPTEMLVLRKNRKHPAYGRHQQRGMRQGHHYPPPRRRHHRHRKTDDGHHCRWIERVFSNTPFVAPPADDSCTVASPPSHGRKAPNLNTPSCIRWNTDGCGSRRRGGNRSITIRRGAAQSNARPTHQQQQQPTPRGNHPHRTGRNGSDDEEPPRGGVRGAESLIRGLSADNVDDEILFSTLLDDVRFLLDDSYAEQAAYRSYYRNSTSDDDVVMDDDAPSSRPPGTTL